MTIEKSILHKIEAGHTVQINGQYIKVLRSVAQDDKYWKLDFKGGTFIDLKNSEIMKVVK